MRIAKDRIAALEQKAEKAAARVEAAKKRMQARCKHPIALLSFDYSGVTSYAGLITSHGMTIRCSCGASFRSELVIHSDP